MDDLLRYYERELGRLGAHHQEFARRYPAIAAALDLPDGAAGDPQLERLLQATAMFNARTAKRLDDAFGQFSDTLLEINFPHYLRPFPSCAIARVELAGHGSAVGPDVVTIPRGTPPDVRVTMGGTNAGFTSLSAALDYLQSYPSETVWAMNWDAPNRPKDRQINENLVLLLAGPDYKTWQASMAVPSLSTISSTWPASMMYGGASSTWSPCWPSMVPPIG